MGSNLVGSGKPAGEDSSLTPINHEEFNSLSQLRPENKKGEFGLRFAHLRIMMGQTQDTLAKMLLTTRQSIVSLEKSESIKELSDGMLFRVYYFAKEISENKFVSPMITDVSKEILKTTLERIVEKMSNP